MKKQLLFIGALAFGMNVTAQHWDLNGNNTTGQYLGTNNNQSLPIKTLQSQPINFFTNNTQRGLFTSGGAMSGFDGLRIMNPSNTGGDIDIWSSTSRQTHIKFNGSGLIQGSNNRFEVIGRNSGLWLNANPTGGTDPNGTPQIIMSILDVERARVGQNGFARIGLNAGGIDAVRRLEVFDQLNAPQFRITQNQNLVYTDFQTTSIGDLFVNPSGDEGVGRAGKLT